MFVVVPSPKFQNRLVIVPVELSVKVTDSGLSPLVGVAVKAETGTIAPTPVTALMLPPASLEKTTALLKEFSLEGVKRIVTFVDENPGTENAGLETIENAPAEMLALAFVIAIDPELVATKFNWEFVPTAIIPKLKLPGLIERFGGTKAAPVTGFVLLPPLLVKTTALLNTPATAGLKITATLPVCPGFKLIAAPPWIAKGGEAETVPVKGSPPEFAT